MEEIKDTAERQAERHLREFFSHSSSWSDVLEKYAELSNRFEDIRKELQNRIERGSNIIPSDFADFYYYEYFRDLMARAIAIENLNSNGYLQDKKGNWILKSQPSPPRKKRLFGNK